MIIMIGKRIYIGLFVLLLGMPALASSQQSQPEWKKNMIEGDRYGHARMFRHALSCYEKAYADPAIKDSVNIQLRLLKNLADCYDISGNGKLLVQTNIKLRDLAKSKLSPIEAWAPGESLVSAMPLVKADRPRMSMPRSKVCSCTVST